VKIFDTKLTSGVSSRRFPSEKCVMAGNRLLVSMKSLVLKTTRRLTGGFLVSAD
jgi:hypothetical protein